MVSGANLQLAELCLAKWQRPNGKGQMTTGNMSQVRMMSGQMEQDQIMVHGQMEQGQIMVHGQMVQDQIVQGQIILHGQMVQGQMAVNSAKPNVAWTNGARPNSGTRPNDGVWPNGAMPNGAKWCMYK